MVYNDDVFLLRKEKVGWIAIICWILGLIFPPVMIPFAWIFTAIWIGMDASYRRMSTFGWTILWIFTGPLGLVIYLLSRRPMPVACYRCGSLLRSPESQCTNCGYQTYAGRALGILRSSFAESKVRLTKASAESSRKTIAYMAIACGVFALLSIRPGVPGILGSLAAAAYWLLVAYWVYLDAQWRRMDPVPWTILTLLTNVVGLATYLVIRSPEPATCPKCSEPLNVGLKHCPYCGTATKLVCPRCQAQIQPGWVFCPSCATQLPTERKAETYGQECPHEEPKVTIRGSVVDAERCSPLPGVEVKIDSKTVKASATTDVAGRFMLEDLEPRPYVLIASAEGFVTQTSPFEPSATSSTPVNFTLSREVQGIEYQGVQGT